MKKHLFCFGYGYTCDYLGYALTQGTEETVCPDTPSQEPKTWDLAGTTRNTKKKEELRSRGITPYIFNFNTPIPDPLYLLKDVTHILISTPPTDNGDTSFLMHAQDVLNLPNLEWVGYLSTTGAYGDRKGAWVDETTLPSPTTKRGSRRYRAEEQWLSLYEHHDLPVHIFRLAGIYGPGRSALDSVRAGIARRIEKPGHAFSRIHVDDIVRVLKASMYAPNPGNIYNVCDNAPAPSHEIIDYACTLLGITPPPLQSFYDVDLAPMAASFYAENKRIHNDKIKDSLGVTLKFPDYKTGLHGCLDAEMKFIAQQQETQKTAL